MEHPKVLKDKVYRNTLVVGKQGLRRTKKVLRSSEASPFCEGEVDKVLRIWASKISLEDRDGQEEK